MDRYIYVYNDIGCLLGLWVGVVWVLEFRGEKVDGFLYFFL